MDKEKLIEQMREYMCAHYPLCRGCPLDTAARKLKISCAEFRKRRPEDTEFIVRTWKLEHSPVRDK